jgi:hypothetical protein
MYKLVGAETTTGNLKNQKQANKQMFGKSWYSAAFIDCGTHTSDFFLNFLSF